MTCSRTMSVIETKPRTSPRALATAAHVSRWPRRWTATSSSVIDSVTTFVIGWAMEATVWLAIARARGSRRRRAGLATACMMRHEEHAPRQGFRRGAARSAFGNLQSRPRAISAIFGDLRAAGTYVAVMDASRCEVLVVDDDSDVREVLAAALTTDQVRAEIAPNAMAALTACRQREFDVVVSDIRMPDMDGVELMGRLKRIQPDLP